LHCNLSISISICSHRVHIASFHKTASWDEGTDCCKWEGVVCDNKKGNVIGLDLCFPSWLNLAGNDFGNSEIPSEFGNLRKLVSLDLGLNYLLCRNHDFNMLVHNLTKLENMVLDSMDLKFPTQVFHLPYLQNIILKSNPNLIGYLPKTNWSSHFSLLDISWTRFSKGLSGSIGNLKHLKTLKLYRCDFMGSIASVLGNLTKITFLYISGNMFQGKIPDRCLPSSTFNLTSLTFMDFSGNFPQGTISNNISGLSYLDLYANLLNGRVPGWLFSLPSLEYLDLSSNKFSGPIDTIPSSFFDFMNLTFLDLSSNNLSGNIKSCMLVKLRNLRNLSYFLISNNELVGEISSKSCNLSFLLFVLDLSKNKLGGTIPDCFRTFSDQLSLIVLRTVSLSGNQLEGSISQSLTNCYSSNRFHGNIQNFNETFSFSSLRMIDRSLLAGNIPPSLGKLAALESLDLSSNKLQGRIPVQLTDLTFSHNNLEGHIPLANHFDTFSNDSFDGNSGLSGFPLSKKCGNDQELESPPSTVADESETTLTWKIAAMGYGSRVVLGLSMGYVVFTTERPRWLVKMIKRNPQKRRRIH
ncbi:hypothetical protein ES288_D07G276500v1, partial [Gossypium darwinii]